MKKKIILLIPALFLILGSVWFLNNQMQAEEVSELITYEATYLEVEIDGKVAFPGVYQVQAGTKVKDLISMAGGVHEDADLSNVNVNQTLRDGDSYEIMEKEKIGSLLVNINTASFEELITVPGITEKRAASIIIHREQQGLFSSLDELLNVKNIGIVTLEKIREFLTL